MKAREGAFTHKWFIINALEEREGVKALFNFNGSEFFLKKKVEIQLHNFTVIQVVDNKSVLCEV